MMPLFLHSFRGTAGIYNSQTAWNAPPARGGSSAMCQNHSSRLIALPNFAYNTVLSFCISLSHSPILLDMSEMCDSMEDLSLSRRFKA